MNKISVVIGCNYGDEGKGLVTDYLASKSKSLVVRFNGGAQAGHTVVTPDGLRHVFHHFGSGTLCDSPTFLSNHFVVNPMMFMRELKLLKDPVVYVDPRAYVTTPYDMMLNQAAERSRRNRHGSCGIGINETIERNENSSFGFKVEDIEMMTCRPMSEIYEEIRKIWVPARAAALGITEPMPFVDDPQILANYILDLKAMMKVIKISYLEEINWKHDFIFEGAQGLLLDENHKNFPYVTRSKTDKTNVLEILKESDMKQTPEFYYVSRSYLTRHGEGPLENELPDPIALDETNVENPFQGKLRFAYLERDSLIDRILDENKKEYPGYFVMTHCDAWRNSEMPFWDKSRLVKLPCDLFGNTIKTFTRLNDYFMFHGPTRNDIKFP